MKTKERNDNQKINIIQIKKCIKSCMIISISLIISLSIFKYINFILNRWLVIEHTRSLELSKKDLDTILLGITCFYILYIIIVLYLIVEMRSIEKEKTENLRDQIWKFIYFTNFGFLIGTICFMPMLEEKSTGNILLLVCGIIFFIGTIIYLVKTIKNANRNCLDNYFSCMALGNLYSIPCSCVWPFIALTDPCCRKNYYTVTTYSDGTTTSNRGCVEFWNSIIFLIKRIIIITTFFVYWAAIIVLTLFWFIIFLFASCCKGTKSNNELNVENNEVILNNDNQNYQSQIDENNIDQDNPMEINNLISQNYENAQDVNSGNDRNLLGNSNIASHSYNNVQNDNLKDESNTNNIQNNQELFDIDLNNNVYGGNIQNNINDSNNMVDNDNMMGSDNNQNIVIDGAV